MNSYGLFFVICIVLYYFILWVVPKVLSWYFEKKFKVTLRVGSIAIPSLRLFNVYLSRKGFTIHIEEISIKSSIFNSEVTKLVTLVIKDVRINKDVYDEQDVFYNKKSDDQIDFRERKIPHPIITFAQFMAIHMYNLSAMFLQSESPGGLLHATVTELHLDGSVLQNAKILLVNANLTESSIKILRRSERQGNDDSCLGELSFAIALEAMLIAQGPLSFDTLQIVMSQTNATIYDGFYGLLPANNPYKEETKISGDLQNGSFERICPIIPKNFTITIADTHLQGMRENGRLDFRSCLEKLSLGWQFKPSVHDSCYFKTDLVLTDWKVENIKEQLLVLKQISLSMELCENLLTLRISLDTLSILYNHSVIFNWYKTNFMRNLQHLKPKNDLIVTKKESFLTKLLKQIIINCCIQLEHINVLVKLDNNNSTFGLSHMKAVLTQSVDRRDSCAQSILPKSLVSDRHWKTELLFESIFWSFNESFYERNFNDGRLKSLHYWGTPLYVGMILITCSTTLKDIKIESMLDTLRLEWSKMLGNYILFSLKCIKDYGINFNDKQPTKSTQKFNPCLTLTLSHLNFFLQSENDEYIIMRLNMIQMEKFKKSSFTNIEHFKLLSVKNNEPFYTCQKSEEITNFKMYIKSAHVDTSTAKELAETRIELLEEIGAYWSCNFHLRLFTLTQEIQTCIENIRFELGTKKTIPTKTNLKVFNIHVFGVSAFYIEISEKHSVKVALSDMSVIYKDDNLSVMNNTAIISIDGADIFTIQGLDLHRVLDNTTIREERNENEYFVLPWNKVWSVNVNLFRFCFPYEHNYADAIQNEFISIFKWLKQVHGMKKKKFTNDSPLPSDLLINIKEFIFETSDDPFEVKLRENFELLVDEFNESLKRRKMLNDKVDELRKTHLHLPATKVEELYANLKKKNAEIYVQRSKQLSAAPPRTRLFACSMTNLELMILADPSIHGTENVIRIIQTIDSDSPWPEDGLEFSTLWCRVISWTCDEWKIQLRDFPQPLLDIKDFCMCGQLAGAEQMSPRRAIRTVSLDLGEPYGTVEIERGMQPLKFYHDLSCEIKYYSYAFGPCWEPVLAQCDLSFDKIFPPSKDPSPRLPFWDKMRLLFHGRFTVVMQQLTVLLHASLDPYNTTEEMELTWNKLIMDWTNARFLFKGDFNIYVRTASKYDDCNLLHLPNMKLIVDISWLCLANPNDHHNVIYCAPNKIPEYSINQVHDSFRAFRSQNVNLAITLETKSISNQSPTNADIPVLLLFGSTLRWFENLKLILSGITRPTRRGPIFNNVRPKKVQLSRHYKKLHLRMSIHKFQVCYWMSFAMQRGCELLGGRLSLCSEHSLSLIPIDDGLKHRPKAEWSIVYMNSELNDSEIWLKSALQDDPETEKSFRLPVEKCYCLSVAKVSYGRETVVPNREHVGEKNKDTPTHRLVVYDLKGAWTKSNRNVAFTLFDTFVKSKQMKKNLSTEALKGFRKETNTTPLKKRINNQEGPGTPPNATIQSIQAQSLQDTPSPLTKLQSVHAVNMLQQLIAEAENKAVVFSDDLSSATRQQNLQGLQACQEDDVQHKNWQIALVNAQVLLKGCETKGYVILSAAKAEIVQRIHRPAWKERTLVSKTTWVGNLECLQYYATVNAGENDTLNENIMWLTVDNIQEKDSSSLNEMAMISEVPNMVGSGVSVGAVVSDTVGASSLADNSPIQLQRIVSRCKCEFFYVGYGDISVDPGAVGEVPPPPQEDVSPWDQRQTAIDAFTLMHHDLDVCTNSLQYTMLLDIVNNLLLYVEPHRKEASERLARMRFQLQLHSIEDQRRPIQNLQTQIRSTMSKLRRLEKETYLVHKTLLEDPLNKEILKEMESLESLVYECKNQLNAHSEELDMMLSCYKESQLLANNRLATLRSDKPLIIVKANEIFFKHAQWRLTEADGQIGIADLVLSNFLYTKTSKSDDSVEHLLELGYLRMTNLLPNQIYKEVLCPTEIQSNMPVEHKRVVRIFCREKPPVGGISVKEHFEINVVPLTIGLTKKFYNTMLKFCFPERDPDNIEADRGEDIEQQPAEPFTKNKKLRSSTKRSRDSNFYIPVDDVEKMKERAEKNKLFIYIKIPEVPVRVSYKGNKEKNLEDIRDFSLIIPTLEYHNVTWTWLDLLMAINNDSRKVILSQAIKQKLQFKRNIGASNESSSPHEEDKACMLLGPGVKNEGKTGKKGVGIFKITK
ncbi:protein hobbit isoform X1 [Onthophagus taurus]|uniref:protein hobbit isoform X1 n=2 Tax=Onthophagus taurus TaxID=166361 RepID=UPI0039BDD1A8